MNTMTLEKLQYNELKDIVKSYCVSGLGKELLNKLELEYEYKSSEKSVE